jgi:hypothetical protein
MATPPDFSVGQVLTSATMNQVGLWLVKTDTITSGTSKTITGAFTADYLNYRIIITNVVTSSVDDVRMRMGTTNSGYYWSHSFGQYNATTFSSVGTANTGQWDIGLISNTSVGASAIIDLFNPEVAQITSFASRGIDVRTAGRGNITSNGFLNNSTAYTSFTLFNSASSTFTSCNIYVYGYNA